MNTLDAVSHQLEPGAPKDVPAQAGVYPSVGSAAHEEESAIDGEVSACALRGAALAMNSLSASI